MKDTKEVVTELNQELSELQMKYNKLNEFLENAPTYMSAHYLDLMKVQRSAMKTYATALQARINELSQAR